MAVITLQSQICKPILIHGVTEAMSCDKFVNMKLAKALVNRADVSWLLTNAINMKVPG